MSFKRKLTLFLLAQANRKYLRIQKLRIGEEYIEACVYESNDLFLGQILLSGEMVLNNRLFSYSVNAQNYIIFHEHGHQKVPFIPNLFLLILFLSAAFLILAAFFSVVLIVINLFLFHFFEAFYYLLLSLLFIFPFSFLQYLSEGHAEFFAISRIGSENYLNAIEEIKAKKPRNAKWFEKLHHKLSYPNPTFLVKLHYFFKLKTVDEKLQLTRS